MTEEKTPLTIAEVAYIAGLFDGEGSVACKKKPTKELTEVEKFIINGTSVVK